MFILLWWISYGLGKLSHSSNPYLVHLKNIPLIQNITGRMFRKRCPFNMGELCRPFLNCVFVCLGIYKGSLLYGKRGGRLVVGSALVVGLDCILRRRNFYWPIVFSCNAFNFFLYLILFWSIFLSRLLLNLFGRVKGSCGFSGCLPNASKNGFFKCFFCMNTPKV